jgi:hypothetical protein
MGVNDGFENWEKIEWGRMIRGGVGKIGNK